MDPLLRSQNKQLNINFFFEAMDLVDAHLTR